MPSPFIIFCNTDVVSSIQTVLIRQLHLSEIIDGYEFDSRLVSDPNYYDTVHLNNQRILVLRDLGDFTNRTVADMVVFIKAGLLCVESNKNGPPGATFPIDNLNLEKLILKSS